MIHCWKNIIKSEIKSTIVLKKVLIMNQYTTEDVHIDEMPKECSHCICLSVILIDSVFKTSKNYYPHVFIECKYTVIQKQKKDKQIY